MNFTGNVTTQVFGHLHPQSPYVMPLPISNNSADANYNNTLDAGNENQGPTDYDPVGAMPLAAGYAHQSHHLSPKAQLAQLRAELQIWVKAGDASEHRQLASEKIYQCLRCHLRPSPHHAPQERTHLSLSGLQLKTLPDCLGRLSHLRSLNLSANTWLTLANSLRGLEQLEELNLSGSMNLLQSVLQSEHLSALLSRLSSLKKLNVSSCMLESLPNGLGDCTRLESLDLSNNGLNSLPEALSKLSALTDLNLGHNRFQILPACVTQLNRLENLDLAFNLLSCLPGTISNLAQLKLLNLSRNAISTLPPEIGHLRELKSLSANYNQIANLPAESCRLGQLTSLSLQSNPLVSLPDGIGQMRNLQRIDLMSTALHTLPLSIGNLSSLEMCNLAHAPIQSLPPTVVCLPATCHIQFRNDQMSPFDRIVWRNECTRIRQDGPHPRHGPILHFELQALIDPRVDQVQQPSLQKIIIQCLKEAGRYTDQAMATRWENRLNILPGHDRDNLETLFQKLLHTRAFVLTRQQLLPQLVWLLDTMEANPNLLQTCASIATESIVECEDRTTLGFIQMGDAAMFDQANHTANQPQHLLPLGKRLFNSLTLQHIAHQHVGRLPEDTDATEVILKYWIELSEELNLPWKVQVMRYAFLAEEVDEPSISSARNTVLQAGDSAEFARFLCRWPAWQAALERQSPERFSQLHMQCESQKSRLHEQLQSLLQLGNPQEGPLLEQTKALRQQYLEVECTVWMEWTLSLLNVSRTTQAQAACQMDDIQSNA